MANRTRTVSPRHPSSLSSRLLTPVVLLGGLAIIALGYLVVSGDLRLPFGKDVQASQNASNKAAKPPLPKGAVAVYACPRNLPAFTKITIEHILQDQSFCTVPALPEQVKQRGLFVHSQDGEGYNKLLGRVLKRDKPMPYAFEERDFLPDGTGPGINAGIPPGQRGIWVDTSKVVGLAELRPGDRIDLVAAVAEEQSESLDTSMIENVTDTVMKTRLEAIAQQAARKSRSRSWVVARGASVIAPIRRRELNPGAANGRGGKSIDEVFLAMSPEDVSRYSQALAQNVTILAAPRTAQPNEKPVEIADDQPADATAELQKLLFGNDGVEASFGMIEVIRGSGARQTVTVPRNQEGQDRR